MRLIIFLSMLLIASPVLADSCFFQSEQRSGNNKICYYRCLSGTTAITVGALEFCPRVLN
jgi:hypothetical protein